MRSAISTLFLAALFVAPLESAAAVQPPSAPSPAPTPKPQPRAHGSRVSVDPSQIVVDDGDSILVRWKPGDAEAVRILGIDTPETRHVEHDLPYAQSFGTEARAFAQGAFAAATQVELLRASTLDPFGRTLGYLYLNGRNYSVLVLGARLAEESVSRYGDNGFPKQAAEVLDAAKRSGAPSFEPPADYRNRMRELSRWLKERGMYPPE